MLRVAFQESLATAFGDLLPVPYINRVYIKSGLTNSYGDTVDGFGLDLSIYVPAVDEDALEPPDAIMAMLADLHVYGAYVVGEQENEDILNSGENIFNHLYNYDPDLTILAEAEAGVAAASSSPTTAALVLETLVETITLEELLRESQTFTRETASDSGATVIINRRNYEQIEFSEFTLADSEGIYDEDSNQRYFVYSATIDLTLAISEDYGGVYTLDDLMDITSADYKKINVYVFCSTLDWFTVQASSSGFDESELQNTYLNKPELLNFMTGELAYEVAFDDGTITDGEELSFIDSEGKIYDGVPIYTVTGEYKKFSQRASLIASISGSATSAASDDANASAASQSLINILDNYSDSTNFLKELNEYRKVFPDKSSTTALGGVYRSFRDVLISTNRQAGREETVFKVISRNPKVIDLRAEEAIEAYDRPDPTPSTTDGLTLNNYRIYKTRGDSLITRHAYSSVLASGEADETFVWDPEDTICDYGYLWFDYEKALRNDTVISSVLNIDKLEAFFGSALVNATLKLNTATLTKRAASSNTLREVRQMVAQFISTPSNYGNSFRIYNCGLKSDHDSTTSSSWPSWNYDKVDVGMGGSSDYSYLCVRNVVGMPSSNTESIAEVRDGYRMLCFYFQDYYNIDGASDGTVEPASSGGTLLGNKAEYSQEHYTLSIACSDYSYLIYSTLRDGFQTDGRSLGEYYQYAEDTGNYNDYTGFFNQFFVDGIGEFYSEDASNAPWLRAPMIFNIHRDLLLNTFEGDLDAIVEDSQKISANIAPESGNLEQLEAFRTRYNDFFTNYYDEGVGVVWNVFADAYTEAYGFVDDMPIEKTYYQEFPILPDIIYAGESAAEYSEEIETALAYPIEDSDWSSLSSSSEASYDTSTLYSREQIRTEINLKLPYILRFIDYLDTTSTTDAELVRSILYYLLTPSDLSTLYAYARKAEGAPTAVEEWYKFFEAELSMPPGVTSSSDLEEDEWGFGNILEYMGKRIWPAANYAGSEFGTSPQITDFYDFLSVDDDYRT